MTKLLSPRQVADQLGFSDAWVRDNALLLGGVKIVKCWRFPPDRIAHVAAHGTIENSCPPAPHESAPQNAPAEAAGTASAGANTDANAKNAATRISPPLKRARPKSNAVFAQDFPTALTS